MKSRLNVGMTLGAFALASTSAVAQNLWSDVCIDPMNMMPYSTDYGVNGVANILFGAVALTSGTVTYGGSMGPCFAPSAVTMVQGGTGFGVGSVGSVQDQNPADPTSFFSDDGMALTFGMWDAPSRRYNKFALSKDGTRTVWGTAGWNLVFTGSSGRYYFLEGVLDGVRVSQRTDVIGDTAKITWTFTNLDAANAANIGMWYGHQTAMFASAPDITGSVFSGGRGVVGGKNTFLELPAGRPPITDFRIQRSVDPANYPKYVNFLFGQNAAFGLRVDLGPTPNTQDASGNSDATQTDELVVADLVFGLGNSDDAFADNPIPDTDFRGVPSYIAKYDEQPVGPLGQRRIVQYFRSPWGNGNYAEPYTVVADAPKLVASDPNGVNGLTPNPMTIRVYVDNAQSLALAGIGVPLEDVRVKLTFPTAQLQLAAGEVETKIIDQVLPRQMEFVDFSVETSGDFFGDLPYKVEINSTPGGSKTLTGTVRVSSTPRLNIAIDANLIGAPWKFDDTSWEAIFQLAMPKDFQAYRWDAEQQGYVPSSTAERGFGTWIVTNNDLGVVPLGSNAVTPPDTSSGAPGIQLKSGWNIIANPYPYAIKLGELVGVPGGQGVATWDQLVGSGLVSSAIVKYDTDTQDYVFVQGGDQFIEPNRGYWIFVNTQTDLTLAFPPVFATFLPGATRRPGSDWSQSDKQWRLKLSARNEKSIDAENYVGVVKTQRDIRTHQVPEVPMSPVQTVSLSIDDQFEGRASKMAYAYTDKSARKTWKVLVKTLEQGEVTVTWPNLTTVPKNMRFKLTDVATGTVTDLRTASGYSFTANGAGTREFQLEVIPGGATRAVIGNVVVTRPSRAPQAPFTIKYTLSSDAQTSIRVLSGSGKEVYTVTRGRSDKTGENEATWAMRDNANRLVAPGAYRIEIVAQTSTGERVRKVTPINVIR